MYKNIIVLCADDLGYPYEWHNKNLFKNLYPRIYDCALKGFSFHNFHTNISVCQPSRAVMMTGLYPFNNGAIGFSKNGVIKNKCKTFAQVLNENNIDSYLIGKACHYAPKTKFPCKMFEGLLKKENVIDQIDFIFKSNNQRKVVFLNSPYPHRDGHEYKRNPDDINLSHDQMPPTILNDIDYINEYKKYILASREFDDLVGMVEEFITSKNLYDDTLFVITSDNTMPFPYYKANCYKFSTHIPLIFIGKTIPHGENHSDFVTVKDMMPTLLEFLNVPCHSNIDGKSFTSTFDGAKNLFTEFASFYGFGWTDTQVIATREHNFFTAAYHNDNYSLIENASTKYEGAQGGADCYEFKVLQKMIQKYPKYFANLKKRSRFEMYDTQKDPFCRNNLFYNKNYEEIVKGLKVKLENYKLRSGFTNKNVIKNLCLEEN